MSEEKLPILMERRMNGLAPVSLLDSQSLERFPFGKALECRIKRGRSNPQLRLYWGLLRKVADNLDQDVTEDDLHEWLKLKLGYVRPVRQRNGEIVEVAASIALDRMPQDQFNRYFDAVKALLVEHIIPGLSSALLEREARAMLRESA